MYMNERIQPQSNQRGIETRSYHHASYGVEAPQSNQRGIETVYRHIKVLKERGASIEPAWD